MDETSRGGKEHTKYVSRLLPQKRPTPSLGWVQVTPSSSLLQRSSWLYPPDVCYHTPHTDGQRKVVWAWEHLGMIGERIETHQGHLVGYIEGR